MSEWHRARVQAAARAAASSRTAVDLACAWCGRVFAAGAWSAATGPAGMSVSYCICPDCAEPLLGGEPAHRLERSARTPMPAETVRLCSGLRIDLSLQRVVVDGVPVRLTSSEFRLLALLSSRPGEVFSAEQIMRHLWQSEYAGTRHSCETHISTLRRKVERDPRFPERVLTVRGRGYKFAAPDASPVESSPGPPGSAVLAA